MKKSTLRFTFHFFHLGTLCWLVDALVSFLRTINQIQFLSILLAASYTWSYLRLRAQTIKHFLGLRVDVLFCNNAFHICHFFASNSSSQVQLFPSKQQHKASLTAPTVEYKSDCDHKTVHSIFPQLHILKWTHSAPFSRTLIAERNKPQRDGGGVRLHEVKLFVAFFSRYNKEEKPHPTSEGWLHCCGEYHPKMTISSPYAD